MVGAREWHKYVYPYYKQLGFTEIGEGLYYINHLIFMFGKHARGYTLEIYLIQEDIAEIKEKGFFKCNKLDIYNVISGYPGWNETYGWIKHGKWEDYCKNILENGKKLYIAERQKIAETYEEQEKIKNEKEIALIKSIEKYFD